MVNSREPQAHRVRIRPAKRRSGILGFYDRHIRPHITRKRVKIAAIVMVVLALVVPISTYAYYARDIGDRERLMNRNNTGVVLKDRNGTSFYSSGVLSSADDLRLSAISDDIEKAVVSSEDKDFYSHHGFSVRGTARAFTGNITSRNASASGGSTITQQLVKNKLLGSQKNYIRKYQELAMAIAVERNYSKEDILEMYLNSAYFGDGAFGINDAAHTYFAKDASQLTLAESSMLIGVLPAPSVYSPVSGDAVKARQAQENVLRKMVATKAITEAQRDEALATKLSYSSDAKKGGAEYAQHFADMVVKKLEEQYGEERVSRSGFVVTTTLDLNKQKTDEAIIKERVAATSSRGGRNAGLVTINPKNGEVLALVGSVDYYNPEFGKVNMATSLRQPGSSFKPIYYSDAIDRGLITAGTIMDDRPVTFGGTYKPRNYDNGYRGKMSVRSALAESRNIPAVEIMQKEGVTAAAKAANRMGITTVKDPQKYGLSLALGTAEVRLMQMTNAYAAFANQGTQYEPVFYTAVTDKYGKPVPTYSSARPKQVLSKEAAFITASMLSDTGARAPTYGSSLNISGKNVALKTGTTNDNKDAWIIGFTPSVVTGVWLGNNENQPMRGIAGGSGAGAIWKRAMAADLKGIPRENFEQPSGVVSIAICTATGERSVGASTEGVKTEYFIKGSEPKGTCNAQPVEPVEPEKKQEDEDEKPTTDDDSPNNNNPPQTTPTPPTTQQPPGPGGTTNPPTRPGAPTQPTRPGNTNTQPRD